MESIKIDIETVYMPAKKRKGISEEKVEQLAEDILEEGQKTPIQVRQGNGRYVLIEGGVRLEAMKMLGEDQIDAVVVQARQH
jgi:sulfiredoxin